METKSIHPRPRARNTRLPLPVIDHSIKSSGPLLFNGKTKVGDDVPVNSDKPQIPATTILPSSGDNANTEAKKYFTFNETGNIMISTTATSTDSIEQDVRKVFNEVTVFFAAMTKAITNTPIPGSSPTAYYSIYDYDALEKIIGGSGLFVEMTKENIDYSTTSVGVNFSKELITSLLGLATGAGALSFASGLIASMGDAGVNLSYNNTSQSGRIGNIVFVCEYMLGIPLVSAIVISIETSEVMTAVSLGPCASTKIVTTRFKLFKEVFLFVSPSFINQYSSDLDSVIDNTDYNQFVDYLQDLLIGQALVLNMKDQQGDNAPYTLALNQTYTINGANFGTNGILTFGEIPDGITSVGELNNQLKVSTWKMGQVLFQGWADGCYQSVREAAICLYTPDLLTLVGVVSGIYTTLTAKVTSVVDSSGNPAPPNLAKDPTEYKIRGSGFGTSQGTISLNASQEAGNIVLTVVSWSDTSISFKVPTSATPIDGDQHLYIYGLASSTIVIAFSLQVYNVAS